MLLANQSTIAPNSLYFEPSLAVSPNITAELRVAAAKLVAQSRSAEAMALISRGLVEHPDSEDLLVMHALLCEMHYEWKHAARSLQRLIEVVQGVEKAKAETWSHWVRALRCSGEHQRALEVASHALQHHPKDEMLNSESQTLNSFKQIRANSFK